MGRLLGLELSNFKSYKGTVKIGFGESNFTSIIGPNGSGKSNMMDAISFVLGIRSNHLRSNVMKDLIYRGVIDNEDDASINSAYVKAFYDHDGKTVELTRSISHNGDTSYRIDDKQVTFKEYSKYLESQNILIKAKNFLVFQGDVEQIASQSANDLSRLFEEVSGSIQYKKEFDELKENLEKINQKTAESIKNRRRIHNELKTYKDGIAKDEEYKDTIEKQNELEKNYALWKLYHLEANQKSFVDDLTTSKANVMALKDKLANEEKKLENAKANYNKKHSLIAKKKSKLDYKKKEQSRLKLEVQSISLPQHSVEAKVRKIEKRIDSMKKELEVQNDDVKRYENQLKVVSRAKQNYELEIQQSNKDLNKYRLKDDDIKVYEEYNEKYLTSGGSSIEEKLSLLSNDKSELTDEKGQIERFVNRAKERINVELKLSLSTYESTSSELTSILNEKNALQAEKMKELRNLQSEIESKSNQEYDLNYKLREALVKIDDLSANQRETLKEKKARENVTTLKRFFPGVRGLVHDLCRPKKEKYALAVSTVLGRNFDSIIVDNLTVAQECIAYLKKQRAGVATFIPLDTIDSEIPTLPAMDTQGCILALNAIQYDSEFERAMQYICNDAIICDDLNIAKKLKWDYGIKSKLVTIEGALIHKAGLMTGGISKDNGNRWDKEEYQSLMNLKDKLILQIEEVSTFSRTASIQCRDLEDFLSMLGSEIASIRTELTEATRNIEEVKVKIEYEQGLLDDEYLPKVNTLNNKISEIEDNVKEMEIKKEKLQEIIYKEFTERFGFTVKEYETHTGEFLKKQTKELQQLQQDILRVENRLELENSRLAMTEGRYTRAKSDLAKANEELKVLQLQKEEILSRSDELCKEIEIQEKDIKEGSQEFGTLLSKINKIEESLAEHMNNLQAAKRSRDAIKETIEKLELEKITILKNCKISNISLPIISEVTLADLPITTMDEETVNISKEIDIDYDELPDKYKENDTNSMQHSFEEEIKEVQQLLETLQPNARAVERYDEAQERFNAVDEETELLKADEKKIMARFLKVRKIRKELFDKAFDHVSEHLDNIYRELTRNPHSSAELSGGNASLTIEDEDEPFNAGIKYHATPPLKRFKDMEYLSGGEKTVAALALLFAINSYQPSPFFVLDEVDAALDISNVERIAAYIRKHGNPKLQFIVISLKNSMFEKSDALVGVYRQQDENSSKVVTLNLQEYAD